MGRTNKNRTLWATTWYNHFPVSIYKRTDPAFTDKLDGETSLISQDKLPGFTIDLADHVIDNPKWFTNTLIHEFTHVLEFVNPAEAFSPKMNDGCTPLARTIGVGLSQLLDQMRQVPAGAKPASPHRRKIRRKGGTVKRGRGKGPSAAGR